MAERMVGVYFETLFGINLTQVLLAFTRISGFIFTAPLFQSKNISPPLKVCFAFGLALIIAPFITAELDLMKFNFAMSCVSLLVELLVGLIIGFVANLMFAGLQLAGYYFDLTLGFGMVNIFDPTSGSEMPLFGQFNNILALLVFLAINGHHLLLRALIESYQVIPPGKFLLQAGAVQLIVQVFIKMFLLGFQVGMPLLGSIFLVDAALGIIAKLLPQLNVFVIGFPIKIALGLLILIAFLPLYLMMVETVFGNSGETYRSLRLLMRQMH